MENDPSASLRTKIRERAAELHVQEPELSKVELEAELIREFVHDATPGSFPPGAGSGENGVICRLFPRPLFGLQAAYHGVKYLLFRRKKDAQEIKQSISEAVKDLFVIH